MATIPSVEAAGRAGLGRPLRSRTALVLLVAVAATLAYVVWSIHADVRATGAGPASLVPFVLLFVALLIALGFEFVNGFHDTANAVATVIYTNALPAHFAVAWSGVFNFLGVLLSSGAVAFGIISLLPVELILRVGSAEGFAMIFALLLAAIVWNLGTWWLGLPASSSHTLIGSIIGVGVANSLLSGNGAAGGVDWDQATTVGKALLLSPLIGFVAAALMLLAMKVLVRHKALYEAPKGQTPPPFWIRALLIFTCTGVSFTHGSNDGQKGMGLIMLILIGTVPTAYALNRAMPESAVAAFSVAAEAAVEAIAAGTPGAAPVADPREAVTRYVETHRLADDTLPALGALIADLDRQARSYGALGAVPAASVSNVRNDMYLASEAIRRLGKAEAKPLDAGAMARLAEFKGLLDQATRFIPLWVKVAVAVALGLGTMVGWKRIVVTVGERIGKSHMTYAQGASAGLVAMGTIAAADMYGLPVSTTQVLSSGVAGTMAANGSGLQAGTVRALLLAWVLTLPAAMLLSGLLFWVFHAIF